MSCIAKIKSPVNGKDVVSSAYYQLTSLYPQEEGKKIYEAITSNTFKANLGFDWTKPHIGASNKVNYAGEPKIREINRHLKLNLPEEQLQAAEQIDELGALGYLGVTLEKPQGFDNIGFEIQMNPKFDMIDHEVISVPGGYQLAVKPKVGEKRQQPISKDLLEKFQFPKFVIDSVGDFNNATLKELIDNLANNAELEPFQQEILKKLSPLMETNPTLKLALFDDIYLSDEYQRSFYDPKTNTIHIAKSTFTPVNNKFLAREIIHETIHAFTLSILNNPRNAQEVQFVQEMEKYFTTYQAYYPELQNEYGFKNIEEFLAEFLSNPYFRERMQQAEYQRKSQFSFLDRMWNSIKSFLNRYLFQDMGKTMFDQVQETLNDYFDYLMTLQDFPDSLAENQIRFSQPFAQRQSKPDISNRLAGFYDYIDSNVDSSIWNQLRQNLGDIAGKETLELRAINALQDTFGKISTADVADSLVATLQYTEELKTFTNKLVNDIKTLSQGKSHYEPEVYLKKLNSAIILAETLLDQAQSLETNLVQQLLEDSFKGLTQERQREIAQKRLSLQQEIPTIDNYVATYKENLQKAVESLTSLRSIAKKEVITPVAEAVAAKFQLIADQMKSPDHPLRKELAFLEEELARFETVGNKKLVEETKKQIADINKALSFTPTTENIIRLLTSATDQAMGAETIFSRYINVAGHSGVIIPDIVNSFINDHVVAATNESLKKDAKIREIQTRIEARNKRRGIGRSILQSAQGTFSIKSSNTRDKFQGFFRLVPVKYYDKSGKVTIITQKVYNTPMLEAEFHNDLSDLKNELIKARKSGDADRIAKAELNLTTFLEDYSERQFVDEYYTAEKLITDDARNARAEILKEIELYSSVFGDDDLDTEITNPVQGSASEKNPTVREMRAKLRRDYVRLGSIYNEDGTEKPIGSKEREIAESILAYNKARKELDVVEFVIGEDAITKFNQIKEGFEKKISSLKAQISELNDQIDLAQAANDYNRIESFQALVSEKTHQLTTETKKQQEWLEANTRVEIKPEFFEKQQNITEQIKAILSKYNSNPEVTEKFQKLFSAVRGFRDSDGTIQGNLVNPGLGKTVKDIEQSIEDLKKQIKESTTISEADQKALSEQFKKLYGLQSKVTTPYYGETIRVVKDKLRSRLTQEERNEWNKKATSLADKYLNDIAGFEPYFDALLSSKNFVEGDFFVGRNREDYPPQESDRQAIIEKFTNLLIEIELNNQLRKTDWYNDNHIAITYEVKDKDGLGSTTITEIRPIYIWRKTIPNDEKYINRNSPSFDWSTPRIRPEYKNPNYKFTGEARPRKDAKDSKYVNQEYDKLEDEEKSIMQDILDIYEDNQRMLPDSQKLKGYVMPNVSKDNKEEVSDYRRPLYKVYSAWESFKLFFKANVPGMGDEEMEEDILQARKESQLKNRGKNVRLIKTRYKEPLSALQTTDNILQALAAHSTYTAEFKGLQKVLPTVFALRDSFAEKAQEVPAQDTNKIRAVWNKFRSGGNTSQKELILNQIDDQIEKFFYGATLRGGGDSAIGRVVNRAINHITNRFQKFVLRYNPLRMPKNVIANILNATGNSSKFGLSKQEMLMGMGRAAKHRSELIGLEQGIDKLSPYLAQLIYFRAIPLADPTNLYRSINSGFVTRYLNADNFNAQWFSSNEAISTLGVYEGIMAKTYVDFTGPNTPPGYQIKLKDAYEHIDGVLVPKDGVLGINRARLNQLVVERNQFITDYLLKNNVTDYKKLKPVQQVQLNKEIDVKFGTKIKAEEKTITEKIEKLRQIENYVRDQIFQLYTSTQGNYYRRGKAHYESIVWMKLIFTMKSWFWPQAANLFGGKKFSVTTGRLDEGSYTTFMGALRRTVLGLNTKGKSLSMDYRWSEREKEATSRVIQHMGASTIMYTLSYYFVNVAMAALKGAGDDDEQDWEKYLLAVLLLGAFDEYAGTLNPVYSPLIQYNKFKTDPLKKSYEKEGLGSKAFRVGYTALFGQQINAIDKILEGYGLLGKTIGTIPRDAKRWYEGKGTFGDIFDEPYAEISGDGYGYVLPHARVKAYEGSSAWAVGLSKVSGVEVGLKSMDFKTKLVQQVSFTPAPGLINPVGQMNTVLSRLDELEKKFNRLSAEDLMAIERNILRYDYNAKKDKVTAVPNEALLNYKMNLAQNEEIAGILQEVATLSTERDRLLSTKEGYAYLRDYEENKRAAAAAGKGKSDFFDSMTKSITGYSKPKFQKSAALYENEARAALYLQLRGIQLGQKDADIRKAYKEEENARIKEQTSQLPLD